MLFVCGRNRARSPTAEQLFSGRHDWEVASAGTSKDADIPVTSELVLWADMIVVMEKAHRVKIRKQFRAALKSKQIVCLDIPDRYEFMDPALLNLLKARAGRLFPLTPDN